MQELLAFANNLLNLTMTENQDSDYDNKATDNTIIQENNDNCIIKSQGNVSGKGLILHKLNLKFIFPTNNKGKAREAHCNILKLQIQTLHLIHVLQK